LRAGICQGFITLWGFTLTQIPIFLIVFKNAHSAEILETGQRPICSNNGRGIPPQTTASLSDASPFFRMATGPNCFIELARASTTSGKGAEPDPAPSARRTSFPFPGDTGPAGQIYSIQTRKDFFHHRSGSLAHAHGICRNFHPAGFLNTLDALLYSSSSSRTRRPL
jgi:hypothetical protein